MSGVLRTIGAVAGIASMFLPTPLSLIAAGIAPASAIAAPIPKRKPMTAINLFVTDDAAYLAADGAIFDGFDGTILDRQPKVALLHACNLAVGVAGRGGVPFFVQAFDRCGPFVSQGGVLAALPRILKEQRRIIDEETGLHGAANRIDLFVAAYDDIQRRPRAYLMGTEPNTIMGALPYTLYETEGFSVPGIDLEGVLPSGYIDDPKADIRRILAAQRGFVFDFPGGCGLGGDCQLVRVAADGVTVETILRFPEPVGERADAATPGEVVA